MATFVFASPPAALAALTSAGLASPSVTFVSALAAAAFQFSAFWFLAFTSQAPSSILFKSMRTATRASQLGASTLLARAGSTSPLVEFASTWTTSSSASPTQSSAFMWFADLS